MRRQRPICVPIARERQNERTCAKIGTRCGRRGRAGARVHAHHFVISDNGVITHAENASDALWVQRLAHVRVCECVHNFALQRIQELCERARERFLATATRQPIMLIVSVRLRLRLWTWRPPLPLLPPRAAAVRAQWGPGAPGPRSRKLLALWRFILMHMLLRLYIPRLI